MVGKKAVLITDKAKNTTFVDCDIEGVKNEGQNTKMIRTKIYNFRKKHPKVLMGIFLPILAGLIVGLILLQVEYRFFVN